MADRVWHCKSCNHVEKAEEPYEVGDSEPCIHCKDGTKRVYNANGFDPDFHNKVVAATGIPRMYFPLNFEDTKPKSRVGVEVIEDFRACSPDMSRLFKPSEPHQVLPPSTAEEVEASDNAVIKDYVRRSKKDG